MKRKELIGIAAIHLAGFSVAAAIIYFFHAGNPGLAFVVGASCGAAAAAMLYHRRVPEQAPFSIKAYTGGVLCAMAILAGLSSQAILKWMSFPEVVIPISVVGSFFFPWAFFGTMQKAYAQKQPR
jgi:hypothetical protein